MWNRVSLIFLLVLSGLMVGISMPPAGHEVWSALLVLIASGAYPFFLLQKRTGQGFWKGALHLAMILSFALSCSFITYLAWYAVSQYQRLGPEFHLLEALSWTFGESVAFFAYLDVTPALLAAVIGYPTGYFATKSLSFVRRNNLEQQKPENTRRSAEKS
jgi:hypothetical protein